MSRTIILLSAVVFLLKAVYISIFRWPLLSTGVLLQNPLGIQTRGLIGVCVSPYPLNPTGRFLCLTRHSESQGGCALLLEASPALRMPVWGRKPQLSVSRGILKVMFLCLTSHSKAWECTVQASSDLRMPCKV